MNEMGLLEDLCAAVAPADPGHLSAARARVLGATSGFGPGGAARDRVPARARRGAMAATWPRLALSGAIAVTAAAALVVAGGIPFGGPNGLAPPASAAQVLQRAAAAAAADRALPVPRDDQFVYVKTTGVAELVTRWPALQAPKTHISRTGKGYVHRSGKVLQLSTIPHALLRYTDETWTSANGTKDGLVRERPCNEHPLSLGGGTMLRACEYGVSWGSSPESAGPPPYTYAWLRTLPTTAAKLLTYFGGAHIKSDPGTSADDQIWAGIGGFFEDTPLLPPKLAAAAFRVAASIPGITLLPHVRDAAGRPGIAVARVFGDERVELIFSPRSYALLGTQSVVIAPGEQLNGRALRPGTVVDSMAILRVAAVNTAPPQPPSGMAPLP
jgi:hypothetical protein